MIDDYEVCLSCIFFFVLLLCRIVYISFNESKKRIKCRIFLIFHSFLSKENNGNFYTNKIGILLYNNETKIQTINTKL